MANPRLQAALVLVAMIPGGCGQPGTHNLLPDADEASGSNRADAANTVEAPCSLSLPPVVPMDMSGEAWPLFGGFVGVAAAVADSPPRGALVLSRWVGGSKEEAIALGDLGADETKGDLLQPIEVLDGRRAFIVINLPDRKGSVIRLVDRTSVVWSKTVTEQGSLTIVGSEDDALFVAYGDNLWRVKPDRAGTLEELRAPEEKLKQGSANPLLVHEGREYFNCRGAPALCRHALGQPYEISVYPRQAKAAFLDGKTAYFVTDQGLARITDDLQRVEEVSLPAKLTPEVTSLRAASDEGFLYLDAGGSVLAIPRDGSAIQIAARAGQIKAAGDPLYVSLGGKMYATRRPSLRASERQPQGLCTPPATMSPQVRQVGVDPETHRIPVDAKGNLLVLPADLPVHPMVVSEFWNSWMFARSGDRWAAEGYGGLIGGRFDEEPVVISSHSSGSLRHMALTESAVYTSSHLGIFTAPFGGVLPNHPVPLVTDLGPTGMIVVDENRLYFASSSGIDALSFAGGTRQSLVKSESAGPLAQDEAYLYFGRGGALYEIGRVPKIGGRVEILGAAWGHLDGDLAVVAGRVCWTADGDVFCVPKTGGHLERITVTGDVSHFQSEGDALFWSLPLLGVASAQFVP